MSFWFLLCAGCLLFQPFRYAKPLNLCKRLINDLGSPPSTPVRFHENKSTPDASVAASEPLPWIIDAGCGSASFGCAARLCALSETTCLNVLAYDKDPDMVKQAKQRLMGPLKHLQEASKDGKNWGNYELQTTFLAFLMFVMKTETLFTQP